MTYQKFENDTRVEKTTISKYGSRISVNRHIVFVVYLGFIVFQMDDEALADRFVALITKHFADTGARGTKTGFVECGR